jgi:hypothetical protein
VAAAEPVHPSTHPGPVSRFGPFVLSFAVTCLLFIDLCGWMFSCGCVSLWAGADAACNVHAAHGPHCPICSRGSVGYAGVFSVIALPQLAASAWWRRGALVRTVVCLLLFPAAFLIAGLLLGYIDSYWLAVPGSARH